MPTSARSSWCPAADGLLRREGIVYACDTEPYKVSAHQNEDIIRLTPEELKRKMAEKEAARQAGAAG